jgi:NADH:ubiquinone oxidoreductase subunit B-like Fe-S oxidoreductase
MEDCREKASFSLWFYHESFACICIVFGHILKSERTDLLRYAIEYLQRERNAVEK